MKKPDEFLACARRLKALADPERLRIVTWLFSGEMNVTDLAAALAVGFELNNVLLSSIAQSDADRYGKPREAFKNLANCI